ncbi:MAG: DUF4126 domain-containing protein [Ktedonobacterales bacterium]
MPDMGSTVAPLSGDVILTLVASLGLSTIAGLRAAAILFAVGFASDIHVNGQALLPLHGSFQVLGSTPMLIVLGILMVAEFVVDKVPGLDHVNDIIATVIRPIVGATIVAGTTNALSDQSVWIAAVVGAILAFSMHAVKSGTRAVSTATTAGVANPFLSVAEDILTVGSAVLLIVFTVVGVILAVITVALVVTGFVWAIGKYRKARKRRQVAQSQKLAVASQPAAPSGYLLTTPQSYPQGMPVSQMFFVPTTSGPVGVAPLPTSALMPQTATMYTTPQSVPHPVPQTTAPVYNSYPGQPQTGPTASYPPAYPPTASYPLDAPTMPGQRQQP